MFGWSAVLAVRFVERPAYTAVGNATSDAAARIFETILRRVVDPRSCGVAVPRPRGGLQIGVGTM